MPRQAKPEEVLSWADRPSAPFKRSALHATVPPESKNAAGRSRGRKQLLVFVPQVGRVHRRSVEMQMVLVISLPLVALVVIVAIVLCIICR